MYFLSQGGIVIDNPGMREVGVTDVAEGLTDLFEDILAYADECKFADCTHAHEPGCAVISAVKSGEINQDRYMNYLTIKKESEFYELNEIEKREKNRKFGKFVQGVKKDLKKAGGKHS
jgi:ribosome biogenesis GTPase